ncbi:drug resistance transporter, EmrB/QacA subfamily [Pseudomonas arsenicoxydans]|uniref:Drug resistance transporter, EmrB/QacA subfamily n=1 Tax=Pseudomonas arsenicoxydans TaxID=702115 RepID=A0A1H0N1I5_9PSED|nr:MFS transporter [Pseudomonas arsenicoxydans]SDO86492.1 drug resistance transporter, EmrB/QacA subfamily [Pseudomonas arsenicoxydans]
MNRVSPRLTLLTASGVCSLIVLDTNIVAVTLPTIARDLGANFADIEWVVSAYMLAFAALLLPAGSLADRFGRQKTLLCGLGIFILASIGCGAAPTALFLDIARAIKGVGAALLLTSALASIGHTFHDEVERAKAWAFWGACMGVAMTAAPTIGGLITEYVGWRWIFYLNLPVGVFLMVMVWRAVPESRDPQSARLDPWGSLAFSASLLCLIWGLIEANRIGWSNPTTYARLLGGAVLMGVFVLIERMQRRPMVDLQLFRHPRFIGALLGMFAYAGCAQVMMTLLPFYLQNGLGFSAIASGLGMLPFAATMLLCPRIGARLAHHYEPATLMAAGLTLVGSGNLLSAWAVSSGGYAPFALAIAVTGAGAGLLNGDTQKNIMACVPRERTGMASGMSTTMRFSAIVLAIGVFGALLSSHTELLLRTSLSTQGAQWLSQTQGIASRVVAGDMSAAMNMLPQAARPLVEPLARQAFVGGFSLLLLVAGLLALLGALVVGTLMRNPIPAQKNTALSLE